MLPAQTILHPTDFSPRSEPAFLTACELARDLDARLVVLHVIPESAGHPADREPLPEGAFEEIWGRLVEVGPGNERVLVEHRLERGDPAAEIARAAGRLGAGLIVLGTSGRSGLARLWQGSVAEQIIRQAPCPVLSVKQAAAQIRINSPAAAASAPASSSARRRWAACRPPGAA